MTQDASLKAAKSALRSAARQKRNALSAERRAAASLAIAQRFMDNLATLLPEASQETVSAYWPIRSEVDPLPLLLALRLAGVATSLPAVAHPTLIFRLWRPGDDLVEAGFGTQGPRSTAPACAPTTLLVPCLAFDRKGGRLGYGAGHFDRAIAQLREGGAARVIAVAFAVQEAPSTFSESHDQPLDAIVTEREVILPHGGA